MRHLPIDREALTAKLIEKTIQTEQMNLKIGHQKFIECEGLQKAINAFVVPNLVRIETDYGIVGQGFFQHHGWLVSNAHIVPSYDALENASFFSQQCNTNINLTNKKGYFRPWFRPDAPDTVVIHGAIKNEDFNLKSLPLSYSEDEDSGTQDRHLFFMDIDTEGRWQTKFLKQHSAPGEYPILYRCMDGSEPQPGSSGSPIIEARLLVGKTPRWQFKVVAMLYGRCHPGWNMSVVGGDYADAEIATHAADEAASTQLVCAIPVIQEFDEILTILHSEQSQDRYEKLAAAAETFSDEQSALDTQKYRKDAKIMAQRHTIQLEAFSSGMNMLNVTLPEGLERLWYKKIVKTKKSLLLKKVFKKEIKNPGEKFSLFTRRFQNLTRETLEADFKGLIKGIKELEKASIQLKAKNNALLSPQGYFRLDISGGSGSHWKLDIQDNTGANTPPHKGQPLSSVFAIVTIPQEVKSIEGHYHKLASLLQTSQNRIETQTTISEEWPLKKPESKSEKKHGKV
jgi:microcompartment protein CcmL/EutN